MITNKFNFSENFLDNFTVIDEEYEGVSIDRKWHLYQVLDLPMISGSILEFGVWKGKSLRMISNHFPSEVVWGFDSFEGLPEDWFTISKTEPSHPKGHFRIDELPKFGKNVKLVKGFFKETLPQWIQNNQSEIKFIHIDSDLYSSARDILTMLNPFIVPGTIILFDELYPWGGHEIYLEWQHGEFKALKEWVIEYDRGFEPLLRSRHMQCSIRIKK